MFKYEPFHRRRGLAGEAKSCRERENDGWGYDDYNKYIYNLDCKVKNKEE